LEVDPASKLATCTYCGSRLRVTRGASGHPLGVLDDIKADTAIIAKQTAINHLEKRLPVWLEERDELQARMREELTAMGSSPSAPQKRLYRRRELFWAAFFFGLPAAIVHIVLLPLVPSLKSEDATPLALLMCLILCILYGYLSDKKRDDVLKKKRSEWFGQTRRAIEARYGPGVAQLNSEIQSSQARIQELKAEMDRLAKEL
jgi:hypothetical protein